MSDYNYTSLTYYSFPIEKKKEKEIDTYLNSIQTRVNRKDKLILRLKEKLKNAKKQEKFSSKNERS